MQIATSLSRRPSHGQLTQFLPHRTQKRQQHTPLKLLRCQLVWAGKPSCIASCSKLMRVEVRSTSVMTWVAKQLDISCYQTTPRMKVETPEIIAQMYCSKPYPYGRDSSGLRRDCWSPKASIV